MVLQELSKAYDASPTQKKKRAALNRENHKRGTYGNGDGKDVAHTKSGKTKLQIASVNRANNGHGKRKTPDASIPKS